MIIAAANSVPASLVMALFIILMSVLLYFALRRKKVSPASKPAKNAKLQHELTVSLVEMKDQNLLHIEHELHEDVAQKLSVARLLTNKIKFAGEKDNKNITEINMLIGECIQDIRNLSAGFIKRKPDEMGFLELVEHEVSRIQKLHHSEISYKASAQHLFINRTHRIILFRLLQTSLHEVISLSTSKRIRLAISNQRDKMTIEISGLDIDFYKFVEAHESTLSKMSNRAKLIDADFSVISLGENGTKISIIYNN